MSTTTPPLLRPSIPTEIHLAIISHLPLHSTACLALTCKQLLHIHGTKSWTTLKSHPTELSAFLLLLERDLPAHYLSTSRSTKLSQRLPLDKSQCYNTKGAYAVLSPWFNITITWDQVVLALKRDRYGAEHGLPLDIFDHQINAPDLSADMTVAFATAARIVLHRVLLRCTYTISSTSTTSTPLSLAHLKSLHLNLCRHTGTASRSSPWYDNTLAKQLSAQRFTTNSLDPDSDVEDVHQLLAAADQDPGMLEGCCSLCMTDWKVESVYSAMLSTTSEQAMRQDLLPTDNQIDSSEKQAWQITTWQNLGSCNSPGTERDQNNEIWKAFAGGEGGYAHLVRVLKYPRGCVKETFEGGEDEGERLVEIERKV